MGCCGYLLKLIDAFLFLSFLLLSIVVPLIDAQNVLPIEYYPKQLVDLNVWYANEYGDYLVSEKPHFFVALVWLEIFLLWPLSIASLIGFTSGKSWYRTTCLMFGVSCFTSMAAIMGELLGSGRASEKMMMVYSPFIGVAVLATLRGLCGHCSSSNNNNNNSSSPVSAVKRPAPERKKRA